jgi:AraC-like DNA-binding protein
VEPKPIGVLGLRRGRRWFDVSLYRPSPQLAELVEHCWTVRWDVRGHDRHLQHTLPHPAVHLVVERDRSCIQGLMTGRFTRVLEGCGRVFGIRFRPAGFRPFFGRPVTAVTDRRIAISEVFGADGEAFAEHILSLEDEPRMVEAAEAFVRDRLPAADPAVAAVNGIVERVAADRRITRVDDLAALSGIGKRTLQRLFREYVGASPKWVIKRCRLHEAAERLAAGDDLDLAGLALDLGYSDQAHFTRDFRAVVGAAPAEYARWAGAPTLS